MHGTKRTTVGHHSACGPLYGTYLEVYTAAGTITRRNIRHSERTKCTIARVEPPERSFTSHKSTPYDLTDVTHRLDYATAAAPEPRELAREP